MFDNEIDSIKDEMINVLGELIKYKSVSIEQEDSDAPFGEECKKSLEYVLDLGNKMGFRTKNIDGYCGYIEFGEGEEMLGIIGHLDVVPANQEDGWNQDPYEPIIIDNKMYGRGTIDDKGPVIASLYAMKVVAEKCNLNKRVRLILGLNEEKDWKCINHYKLNEEHPTLGFSPDANFPCIYAEKGIFTAKISSSIDLGGDIKIISVDCQNNAINVVPKYASLTLEYYTEEAKNRFLNLPNINTVIIDDKTLKLEAYGKSAHAAYPEEGDNAITKLLVNLPENNFINILKEEGFFEIISPKYLGGYETNDESGKLTSNIAIIEYKNDRLYISTNFRVPVKTNFDYINEKMQVLKERIQDLTINLDNANPKLFVSKESYLVKTLTNVFNEYVNGEFEPIATGGGTYARAFKNCVACGAIMPNEQETYHQVNECIDLDNFILASKIYAKAIYELAK